MEKIISIKHISKQYITYKTEGSLLNALKSLFHREKVLVDAVNDISFTIEKGEIIGLLGKNGAGKSSIIKMLTGVLLPTGGEIEVMGYNPFHQRSKYVKEIGVVFGQKSQLIWDIPPIDSFRMNQAIYSIEKEQYEAQLTRLTTLFQVEEVIHKPTRVLSLGERMKCEFIMAMLHNPKVVFLDEPTIGLDMFAKETIRNFIIEMNALGVTFILTTHDLEEIEKLAQRVIIINHGKKVFEDTIGVLKKHLGNKKNVSINMKTPIQPFEKKGITVVSQPSDNEMMLIVDNEMISINEFIAYVNELGEIVDISIKELDIEEIIKSIYD